MYSNNILCINNKESNKNVLFSAMTSNVLVDSSSMKTSQHGHKRYVYLLKLQINLDKWKLWLYYFFVLLDVGSVRIIYCLLWGILSYLISENVVLYKLLKETELQ